jgi:hypothetical protein
MLTTRATKREKGGPFVRDMRFDVLDGERQVGAMVFDFIASNGTLTFDGRPYAVARAGEKIEDIWTLKDEAGGILAQAERKGEIFTVSRGGENFLFRKVWRPYHLYRAGSDQSLGLVGQKKFFTRLLHMELPPEFEPAFQAFLLVLVLGLSMDNLEALGRSR